MEARRLNPSPGVWSDHQPFAEALGGFAPSGRQFGSTPLADSENRAHGHQWVRLSPSGANFQWESFQPDGGAANQDYFTTRDTAGLPYVQLLACREL